MRGVVGALCLVGGSLLLGFPFWGIMGLGFGWPHPNWLMVGVGIFLVGSILVGTTLRWAARLRSSGEDVTEESPNISRRHRINSLFLLTVDVVGLLFLLYCTTIVVTRFRLIFDDLLQGNGLPALTHLILSIPRSLYVIFFVGVIAALIYKELRISNKTRSLVINLLAFAAAVFLYIVLVVAFFLPMISIC